MKFEGFPKIPRLMKTISISEKIDGTNASVMIAPLDEDNPSMYALLVWEEDDGKLWGMYAGSRKRLIVPEADNFGFARWVQDNAQDLKRLGPGHHFGEWWGFGIQRGYGLDERRFSLFNPRWLDEEGPECVSVVPQLWTGKFDEMHIDLTLDYLVRLGSEAAPGFMDPEGIVVYHHAARQLFKVTIGDDGAKSV